MAKKQPGVPTMLLEMALNALPRHLAELRSCGAVMEDFVWAFFDGRVMPGRRVATMQLRARGLAEERAARDVDAAIKQARAKGSVFALGMMLTTQEFLSLLRQLAGDESSLASFRAWLDEPIEQGWFRIAVISGATTQLQSVSIESVANR